MQTDFSNELNFINDGLTAHKKRLEILREKDLFVLDNSIRETTVGQLRGHTLEDKIRIYEETKKCGFKYRVVAAFNHCPRVGDAFCQYLKEKNEDRSGMFSFSDVTEEIRKGKLDTEKTPIALIKCKKYGIPNVQFEFDLADPQIDWEKFSIDDYCQLLLKRLNWCRENLSPDSKVLFGLRDFPFAMNTKEGTLRVLKVVHFLGSLPKKGFGICFEEPVGKFYPEQIGPWCGAVRRVMNQTGWKDGKLLVHIHKRWGLSFKTQLECLVNGADGVWAGVCEEGAAVGHASSIVTIMNLVRVGNTKVLQKFNCKYLREAAVNVTVITTGKAPHSRELIYGERALDLWFAGEEYGNTEFDLALFFGEKAPVRISDISSLEMFQTRLEDLFGKDPQFNKNMALKMKKLMLKDMAGGRKEEYMSETGIALLFNRAGGKLTKSMRKVIEKSQLNGAQADSLVDEVKRIWIEWGSEEITPQKQQLSFNSFFYGMMEPYFDGFDRDEAQTALKALDLNLKGFIGWDDFSVYLKWATRQYPELTSVDDLLSITFRKGLIPVMHEANQKLNCARSELKDVSSFVQIVSYNSYTNVQEKLIRSAPSFRKRG